MSATSAYIKQVSPGPRAGNSSMNQEQSKSLQDYLVGIRLRRSQMVVIFTVMAVLGVLIALLWPPTYRSTATILIEEQQIPSELVQSTVTSYAAQRIQTISQRVMTRENMMGIINKFGLYSESRERETTEETLDRMRDDIELEMISADVVDPRTGRPTTATIAFSLAFNGQHPEQVQRVANELTTLYLQENIKTRASKAQETLAFLTDEANRLNKTIAELEQKMADFKAKNSESLPELQTLLRQQIERVEREISDTTTQIRALEERRFYLEGQLGPLDPYGDDVAMSPSARLKALRIEYAAAASRYSADHPDVLRMKREIENLERETGQVSSKDTLREQLAAVDVQLAAARDKYSEEHPDVVRLLREKASLETALSKAPAATSRGQRNPDNPAYVTLQAQLHAALNDIRSLQERRTQLEKKIESYEARLTAMPLVEGEYRNLTRDLENANEKYKEIKYKQMQAQVAQQLESESKGERFSLIDPPALPEEPIKPNRPAIIFLSFVLALAGSLGYALLADNMDSTIRGSRGVLATLNMAPLSVIPYLATDTEQSKQRGRKRVVFISVVTVVGLIALLIHLFIQPLDVLWFRALRRFSVLTGIDL